MDFKRQRPKRPLRALLIVGLGLAVLMIAGTFVVHLKARLPTLDRGSVWIGRVEKGSFAIRVRGAGTLVPEAVRWLTAQSSGRVEEILLDPGAKVVADTAIVRLENLDVRLLAVQGDQDVASVRSQIIALEQTLGERRLAQQSDTAALRTKAALARRRADAYSKAPLAVAKLVRQSAAQEANDLSNRADLAEQKLQLVTRSAPAQLASLRTQLKTRLEMAHVRHKIVDQLTIRAGASGTLEDVMVELGQWVLPGTDVARVIVSDQLEAELKVPEEQAGGIAVGEPATIDLRSGKVSGHVRRVASAASHGTVLVEIALNNEMLQGTRPYQSINGTIEIDRIDQTLYLPRPMHAEPNATVSLFRIDGSGTASRVHVTTGRASVDSIEILSGLEEGDEVILSDTSRFADVDLLTLE